MLVSLGLVVYPMINQIIRSFKDPKAGTFTFDNYVYLFTNKVSSRAIWYTVEISVLTVLLTISISYLLAMFLRFSNSKISKLFVLHHQTREVSTRPKKKGYRDSTATFRIYLCPESDPI